MSEPIPVTVLTGYLGAGKTTLLNRILSEDHGHRYAVIVNEFGEIGIDNDLVLNTNEELIEMNNGCVCCTVRGDLIRSLRRLLATDDTFDAIILETTGLADPGPVAQTFFVDPVLQTRALLDSVTTVVDAQHLMSTLATSREAVEQIAFADQIVLNKVEMVEEEHLGEIENCLRRINPWVPIHRCQRANVALDKILGLRRFDLDRIVSLEPDFLDPIQPGDQRRAPTADPGEHDHQHDNAIQSVALTSEKPLRQAEISNWLSTLLAEQGADILRAKGIIEVAEDDRRLVFQSVHMVLEGDFQQVWPAGEKRISKLVFIGRNLNVDALRAGFEACIAGARPGSPDPLQNTLI